VSYARRSAASFVPTSPPFLFSRCAPRHVGNTNRIRVGNRGSWDRPVSTASFSHSPAPSARARCSCRLALRRRVLLRRRYADWANARGVPVSPLQAWWNWVSKGGKAAALPTAVDVLAVGMALAGRFLNTHRLEWQVSCLVFYRYHFRESCSQFDLLPLTSLTISVPRGAVPIGARQCARAAARGADDCNVAF
jgi:hypothetical protein